MRVHPLSAIKSHRNFFFFLKNIMYIHIKKRWTGRPGQRLSSAVKRWRPRSLCMRCTHTQGGKGRRCINMRLSLSKGHIVSFFFYLGLQTSYKARKEKKKKCYMRKPLAEDDSFYVPQHLAAVDPLKCVVWAIHTKKEGGLAYLHNHNHFPPLH